MNYSALIQVRRSVREFTDKQVSYRDLDNLRNYYLKSVRRLIPEIKTELYFFGTATRAALEGAAGYNRFLVGAPQYLVLMSEKHKLAHLNGGYIMEDLVLKLTDMDLNTCWLTFTDSEDIKTSLGIESGMDVVAMIAFGYGAKTTKRLRLNIRSMSDVDVVAQHRYMEPKNRIQDMTFLDTWGNTHNLRQQLGFFDDMLWEALYAATLSPSYLNRQAYGFLLRSGRISLISKPDPYNTEIDRDLSLGIVLHHFSSVAENWTGRLNWDFAAADSTLELPEGHKLIATCTL